MWTLKLLVLEDLCCPFTSQNEYLIGSDFRGFALVDSTSVYKTFRVFLDSFEFHLETTIKPFKSRTVVSFIQIILVG